MSQEPKVLCNTHTRTHARTQVRVPTGPVGEFFSPGSTFCADSYFSIYSTPMLLQKHKKDPGHFAKSASERLQLNPHAPYVCAEGSSHGSATLSSFPLCSWSYSVLKGGGLVDCASSDLTIGCLTAHWQGVRGFFRVCVLLQWFPMSWWPGCV